MTVKNWMRLKFDGPKNNMIENFQFYGSLQSYIVFLSFPAYQ